MLLIRNVLISFYKQLKCNGLKWEINHTTIIVNILTALCSYIYKISKKLRTIISIASDDLNITYEDKNKELLFYHINYY